MDNKKHVLLAYNKKKYTHFLRPFSAIVFSNYSAFFPTPRPPLCICVCMSVYHSLFIFPPSVLCVCAVLQEDLQILFFLPFQFNFHFFCSVVCFLFILFCCVSFFSCCVVFLLSPLGQFFPFMWQLWSIGAYINDWMCIYIYVCVPLSHWKVPSSTVFRCDLFIVMHAHK